ncbi:MAG: fumarylacetoacetate hydrolase family protein [Chloroflexi bacterium]|nr:fumarylacetoacetate hydrolase family protein [Chloroflexota bacterium]
MRIVRFAADGKVKYGTLATDVIRVLKGSPFDRGEEWLGHDGAVYRLGDVKLLAPCRPSKLVCLGLNYRRHAEELNMKLPTAPLIFLKPSTAVVGPEAKIVLPRIYEQVDYEGELGVVIGRRARHVPKRRWRDCVLGFTCVNDVTERRYQELDGQWTRAKSYDTFAPIGPWIETEMDPSKVQVETYLNGQLCQSGCTDDLVFAIPELIGFITGVMTLLPGDIIATGTPYGVGPMRPGDAVEVRVEKIGALSNYVT